MASEETAEFTEQSLLDQLITSRNRDLSLFLPFILGFTNGSIPDPIEISGSDNLDQSRDRIILINPLTQGMVVIEGNSLSLDSLLQDLLRKDGQPPASKASIEAMSSVEMKGDDVEGECVICLELWAEGDVAKEMPCKHRFHGECVEKWLGIHGSCPVCRYKMPVEDVNDSGKIEEERERERGGRREIWVSFSFNSDRRSENQTDSSTASSS